MGVGGNFWDILKPFARFEGFDFLRGKKVAVDLSCWIVQHETAIRSSNVRNPHLRITFFRTINLISTFGAFPVFIVDGAPSPLKYQTRISRFFRYSCICLSDLPAAEEGVSVERNRVFQRCVEECVELLKLLGMPVLQAKSEGEALCAQLNNEGLVDACITTDSDAFLFGAKCVIKSLHPNSSEPFECYHMADIEAGLGLRRKHLIAISLLVGNDFDLSGVQGVGLDTALRFIKCFSENEVFNRLCEIGSGIIPLSQEGSLAVFHQSPDADKTVEKKITHCSLCGHPGNKTVHCKVSCEYCSTITGSGCTPKPADFKCECASCHMERQGKEWKKNENWHLRVCKKISMEQNFPNKDIIEMYCDDQHGTDLSGPILWGSPCVDMLVDFMVYHLHWEPSYIRQKMLPMLSTIFLREMGANRTETLLHGQYEFDSIQRVKIRYGHQFYVIKWKKPSSTAGNPNYQICVEEDSDTQPTQVKESVTLMEPDDSEAPQVYVDDGCSFLLTDENMNLVQNAFPEKVNDFLQKKATQGLKRRQRSSSRSEEEYLDHSSGAPSSKIFQRKNITGYYRSTKVLNLAKPWEESPCRLKSSGVGPSKETGDAPSPNLPKSVRRKLLFG